MKTADGSEGGPALKVQRWISNHAHLRERKRVSERERGASEHGEDCEDESEGELWEPM